MIRGLLILLLVTPLVLVACKKTRNLQEASTPLTETERIAYIEFQLRDELANIESIAVSVQDYQDLIESTQQTLNSDTTPDLLQQMTLRIATFKIRLNQLQEMLKAAQRDYDEKFSQKRNEL